jgi:REP element-mobilizing transposase RayT
MSLPREVIPGRFYLITRRCTQRQFLLRPDNELNNAFTYCLAETAQRFGIDVMLTCAMSNHHHTVIYDRHGNYPEFLEHFHKMTARCLNVLRRRWENFWSSEQVCVVRLHDVDDVLEKLAYVATNPVNADLVEHAHQWPGVTGYPALLRQRAVTAHRPAFFFRKHGAMPETVTLKFVIPPELGAAAGLLQTLAERVQQAEDRARERRRREGKYVLGRKQVLAQSYLACARTVERRRGLRPRIAARDKWTRLEAIRRNRDFLYHYRGARLSLLLGVAAPFPPGTYWLRRFAAVPIADQILV